MKDESLSFIEFLSYIDETQFKLEEELYYMLDEVKVYNSTTPEYEIY
jgi:hypothetical protein